MNNSKIDIKLSFKKEQFLAIEKALKQSQVLPLKIGDCDFGEIFFEKLTYNESPMPMIEPSYKASAIQLHKIEITKFKPTKERS